MSGGKIIQIFQDADLRCSHEGLALIADKEKVNIKELKEGEYVVFFNTKRTMLKVAAAHNTIAHTKTEMGRFFDVSCIVNVVRAFHNTGKLDYSKALKEHLEKLLARKAEAREEA